MKKDYIIITNNPLVPQMLDEEHEVDYSEISYEDVLGKVRDRIHEGHLLLSHPLSGSVKPNETPYKSVMISRKAGKLDERSLSIIEGAIRSCAKFEFKSEKYREFMPETFKDFQLIALDPITKRYFIRRCVVGRVARRLLKHLAYTIISKFLKEGTISEKIGNGTHLH